MEFFRRRDPIFSIQNPLKLQKFVSHNHTTTAGVYKTPVLYIFQTHLINTQLVCTYNLFLNKPCLHIPCLHTPYLYIPCLRTPTLN